LALVIGDFSRVEIVDVLLGGPERVRFGRRDGFVAVAIETQVMGGEFNFLGLGRFY
jgi:hypothetical protein